MRTEIAGQTQRIFPAGDSNARWLGGGIQISYSVGATVSI